MMKRALEQNEKDVEREPPTKREKTSPKLGIYCGGGFEKLVTESSIFVDKSLFIEEIMNSKDAVTLITMPRRWGKSSNLEMLKKFLEIQVDENGRVIKDKKETLNYKLFAGGKIQIKQGFTDQIITIKTSKLIEKIPEALNYQGQYPVISIDFKDCKGSNANDIRSKLYTNIIETVRNFSYLKDSEKSYKETTVGLEYKKLLNKKQTDNFNTIIKDLCSLLHAYHQKKVWVLIDEYDAAANQAYREFSSESAKVVTELFRGIFEASFKGNDYLEKGLLTGVQYIVQSGMLSGVNNLSKYNITNKKYSQYYAINPEEMDLLLEHFSIEEPNSSKIKDWYNGYQENIGSDEEKSFIDKYNIWSVVNYLNRQDDGFKSYWEKSGSIDFISHLFKKQEFKEQIELLVSGGSVHISSLKEDFTVDDFNTLKEITSTGNNSKINVLGLELIFSYFFITGYLTIVKENPTKYQLPNKEIIKEFGKKIEEYYKTIFNIDTRKFLDLTDILSKVFDTEALQEIKSIFKDQFAPTLADLIRNVSLYTQTSTTIKNSGLFANEDLMHSLLNNIVLQVVNSKFASERYTTKPDGTKGRADIVIEKNNIGVLIEMKYNGIAEEALRQSKDYERLIDESATKIFIGCNISSEQKVILSGEIVGNSETISFEYP
ncbi:hypothetical protein phytr_11250 [Candidatus Phycorickettsia trachydisci]|uniref:AAA-ATPase-like domain-containing protein n=1 Tax=Candidatus Phycorickettsia trachydisci TaxID=2115978 RepID=A0A2P1P9W2_9RICK|nr:AAA family ATPase [Candidatus Phycorickettsia trachydisci]AVP88050.1 hypothetical protein phytr_11250 [Candidatus Phycorickettsia trachydisci]